MTTFVQVTVTTETREQAQTIARALVEAQLAACVQILGPITSVYRWEGEVEEGEEWLCLIKSSHELMRELEEAILVLHPYEVPEILALPVMSGSPAYLRWLQGSTRPPEELQ